LSRFDNRFENRNGTRASERGRSGSAPLDERRNDSLPEFGLIVARKIAHLAQCHGKPVPRNLGAQSNEADNKTTK
jgi:hypothetical protein